MNRSGRPPRDDQWSESDVRRVIANVFNVSLGTITPQVWTQAMAQLIQTEGAETAIRAAVRSFNEGVEGIQQFAEAIDEDEYCIRFSTMYAQSPSTLATALLDDLLPRAQKWSSKRG